MCPEWLDLWTSGIVQFACASGPLATEVRPDGWQLTCTHIYIAWKFHFQIFSLSQLTVLLKLVMRKLFRTSTWLFLFCPKSWQSEHFPFQEVRLVQKLQRKLLIDNLLEEDNISDVTSPWTSEVLFEKHLEL